MAIDKVKYLQVEVGAAKAAGWDVAICFAYIKFRRNKDKGWLPSVAKLSADLCGEGYTIPNRAIRFACQTFKKRFGINKRMRRMPADQVAALKAAEAARKERT